MRKRGADGAWTHQPRGRESLALAAPSGLARLCWPPGERGCRWPCRPSGRSDLSVQRESHPARGRQFYWGPPFLPDQNYSLVGGNEIQCRSRA